MKLLLLHQYIIVLLVVHRLECSHFRGGSIFWKPTGNGNEVEFTAKLGWATEAKCNSTLVNVFQNRTDAEWKCENCVPPDLQLNLNSGFTCTGYNSLQKWERTESTFRYTMPGTGPYNVSFKGGAWINALNGGNWRIVTTVDLNNRSDTSKPNQSPVVPSKPVYYIKQGCKETIKLPVTDEDHDTVTCRWSRNDECVDVCQSSGYAPVATLNPITCEIAVDTNLSQNGTYALAITLEDRPKSTITIGGKPYSPNDVISSVPLQFVLETPKLPGRACSDKPVFVTPTPLESDMLRIHLGDTLFLGFYARSQGTSIVSFTLLDPPANVHQFPMRGDDQGRGDVFAIDVVWSPKQADLGVKTLCVEATDTYLMNTQRCVKITAYDQDPCDSTPCQHNGTCLREGYTDIYNCSCTHGFTGSLCEIDIDECASNPCQHNATCVDHQNGHTCTCMPGFTDPICGTDIDECLSAPCKNNGTCYDLVNSYFCLCVPGFTDPECATDINECASNPCQNGATCFDLVNEFFCGCEDGYTDDVCGTDINECAIHPCINGGTCVDFVGGSQCLCPPGFTGEICQNGIDSCAPRPCGDNGVCLNHGVHGYSCQCADGWLGVNCQYRFENETFFLADKSGIDGSYLHYSDCECAMGNEKRSLCYKYTAGKYAGFGFLATVLGLLTSVFFYFLFYYVFGNRLPCNDKPLPPKAESEVTEDNVETILCEEEKPKEKLEEPKIRRHHCWACDVKYNHAKPPLWYHNGLRKY